MYRGYYIDIAGNKRECMGFYTLNSATRKKNPSKVYIVEARDKASAANKINKKYGLSIAPWNLRQVPKTRGRMLLELDY